jgi:phage tail tape-measure protein
MQLEVTHCIIKNSQDTGVATMETMKEFQMIDKRTAAGVYPAEGNLTVTQQSGAAALSLEQRIRYHANLVKLIN